MGICSSCESTSVATVMLILQDGRLEEFSYPVKVSYVLRKDPTSFICNSDEMEFDDVASAISDEEELQPGQLYFALPVSLLMHKLQAEEMAALAVKANSALMKSSVGGDKCGCRRKPLYPVILTGDNVVKPSRRVADSGGVGEIRLRRGRGRSGGGGGRRQGNFKANLTAIPE